MTSFPATILESCRGQITNQLPYLWRHACIVPLWYQALKPIDLSLCLATTALARVEFPVETPTSGASKAGTMRD